MANKVRADAAEALDGVLFDSDPVWEEVRRGLVAERHWRWPPDTQRRLMGMSTAEWSRYLATELGVDLAPDEVARTVIARMVDRYRERLPLLHQRIHFRVAVLGVVAAPKAIGG